jgi:hypothetical protein
MIDEKTLADLRTQNGKLLHLKKTIDDEEFEAVFRKASKVEFKKWLAESQSDDEATKGSAFDSLALACCVWPDREAIGKMLAENPGLPFAFGNAIVKAAGLGQAEVVKK